MGSAYGIAFLMKLDPLPAGRAFQGCIEAFYATVKPDSLEENLFLKRSHIVRSRTRRIHPVR